MSNDIQKWDCSILRRLTFVDTDKLQTKKVVNLWHNFQLPFIPFVGLKVEYFNMSYDQGIEYGEILVERFSSELINAISWDCEMEQFNCYEKNLIVKESDLTSLVTDLTENGWFVSKDDNLKNIAEDYLSEINFATSSLFAEENWV